ncbi:MAG: transcription antitermination factor NusB [Gemmatimonadota bacterium]
MRLTRVEQRLRRRARARAMQAVYAWDVVHRGSIVGMTQRLWDDLALGAEERAFATPIIRMLELHGATIDGSIAELTTNWRMERVGAIERAVLRLGAAELMWNGSELRAATPPRVAIQEAVLLAERFGSEESARFVNGVLDALARKLGRI